MQWSKILLTVVVITLYIPMVFMAANVFFPEYTDNYYDYGKQCPPTREGPVTINETCFEEQRLEQQQYRQEKLEYEGNKYVFIVAFNLLVLLLALFINFESSIVVGLFLGNVLATFTSTWGYFESKSILGFIILVAIFFISLYFITVKKDLFTEKKSKK